jgi:hypothetical protein
MPMVDHRLQIKLNIDSSAILRRLVTRVFKETPKKDWQPVPHPPAWPGLAAAGRQQGAFAQRVIHQHFWLAAFLGTPHLIHEGVS